MYACCSLIEKKAFFEMYDKISIVELIDPIQIRGVICQRKLNYHVDNVVKLINFRSKVSLDFVKSYIYYQLNTEEYGSAGFFVNYNSYYPKGNIVKFGCYCNFFRYGTCNKKIDVIFFIEKNILSIRWNGDRCDCKKEFL